MSDTAWDRLEWAAEAVVEECARFAGRTIGDDQMEERLHQLGVAVAEVQHEREGEVGDDV